MQEIKYNRIAAIEYAKQWALDRNPAYYNFDTIGGDCTNFVSQCIYAGCKIMNYTKARGWYYINGNQKSPSWTGVEFLYQFLINNAGIGPYGKEIKSNEIKIGDIVQLSFDGQQFTHSLMVIDVNYTLGLHGIRIASHTFDSFHKKITEYDFQKIRFIHIEGARK